LLEGAVGPPAERAGEAVAAVLVVVEPQRLLARVALRGRVLLVSPDADEAAVLDLHLDPAVDRTEDAGRLVPAVVTHVTPPITRQFNERTDTTTGVSGAPGRLPSQDRRRCGC